MQITYLFYTKNIQKILPIILGARCQLDMISHYYNQLQKFNFVDQLSTVLQKCLIIHGQIDSIIHINDIELLQKIPNSRSLTFKQQGHFLPLTMPFKFNKTVHAFLEFEEM